MKILIVGYGGSAGVGTYSKELANNLKEDNEIELIIMGDNESYNKSGLNCEFINLPISKVPHFSISRFMQCKKIEKIINKTDADLVHSVGSPLMSFVNSKKPIVVTAWFYPPTIFGSIKVLWQYQTKLKFLPSSYIRFVTSYEDLKGYQKSNNIFAVTKKLADALKEKGYRATYMPPAISKKEVTFKKFDTVTLIFVALYPTLKRKGLNFLLHALDYSIKNKLIENEFQLIIIGKKTNELLKHAKSYKFIKLAGLLEREKTLEIVGKSHILVAPSIYEEFGYNVLEGMSYGIPIIASDIPSFQDMVENDRNGYLVDIKNTEGFAKKLSVLINDGEKRKKFGENSLEIIKNRFSPYKLLPQLKEEYFNTINIKN